MAWPPVIPPNTRTNDTDMVDVHASDHNAISTALTELVAQVNPSAWVALPFASGWASYGSGYQICQYRKIGDQVQLRGLAARSPTTASAGVLIATLPAGFRPAAIHRTQAMVAQGVVEIDIKPDGTIMTATVYPLPSNPSFGIMTLSDMRFSVAA